MLDELPEPAISGLRRRLRSKAVAPAWQASITMFTWRGRNSLTIENRSIIGRAVVDSRLTSASCPHMYNEPPLTPACPAKKKVNVSIWSVAGKDELNAA